MPEYISKSLALAIHEDLIRSYGGSTGLRDEGRLEAVLASPQASFAGQELYPTPAAKAAATPAAKAAAYLVGMARGHPFVDGNKRTAFALADTFLRLNGWRLTMTNADLFELVLAAARGELDTAGVAAVFERASERVS